MHVLFLEAQTPGEYNTVCNQEWSYGNAAPTCGHASPIVSDGTVYTGLPDGELVAFRTR